jgi:quercetin dioxygenase-like cupin family protein
MTVEGGGFDVNGKDASEGSQRSVFVDRLAGQELDESQPAIYDRPIGLRLLFQEPRSGAEHYLVRYPAGLRARRHRHSAAHTIVVIDGTLRADEQILPAGSYAHFPAGTPMLHEPAADQDCLFVILFDGPFDVIPCDGDDHDPDSSTAVRRSGG